MFIHVLCAMPIITTNHCAALPTCLGIKTIQKLVNDIATNAARVAVHAMVSAPLPAPTSDAHQSEPLLDNATAILQTGPETQHGSSPVLPAPTTCLPYGKSFHDVPASYVKKIQSGEFFELSKLLSKNLFNTTDEQSVLLTVEKIKVKPANQSTTTVTDIEQSTTAFTMYMSVFTHADFLTELRSSYNT